MPKSLSEVPRAGRIWINSIALKQRPELASYIVFVVNTWAYADAQLTSLLTVFLKSDYRIVHEMLGALYSTASRRAALIAAAHLALSDDDKKLFDRVNKATKPSRITRDHFVHRLWATAEELPDALLLMDAGAYSSLDMDFAEFLEQLKQPGPKSVRVPRIPDEAFVVYEREDLIAALEAAEKARDMIGLLESAFSEPSPARDHARLLLSNNLGAAPGPP